MSGAYYVFRSDRLRHGAQRRFVRKLGCLDDEGPFRE